MHFLLAMFEWFWKRKKEPNALTLLHNSNSELRQLLFLEKKHSSDLLEQLKKALGNSCETVAKELSDPTPREQEVLNLLKTTGSTTSKAVCVALGYAKRQIGCALLLRMVKKGFLKKQGAGKLTKYVFA